MPNMLYWELGTQSSLQLFHSSVTLSCFVNVSISFLSFQMKAAVPLPSIKRFESGSTSEDFFRKMPSKIVRHGLGKMGFDMEQADGVNRCLSSFSIYASLQSVTHNFMPHHRNGCRARSRVPHVPHSIQLASQELLAQGAFKVLSQTLEDAKKQMLPFILLQLTRKGCSKGLAFQI